MNVRGIVEDSRVAHIRELKAELADVKARLVRAEGERDSLSAHFALALAALRDFEQIGEGGTLRIIDGWNAILRSRNVAKLTGEQISALKAEYLAGFGITPPDGGGRDGDGRECEPTPLTTWIIFDGAEENSYRSGPYRVTYTGGTGPQRADHMILDYVHAAKILGMDVSRIMVETADKALAKKLESYGVVAVSG
jgi:hypothetical protein